MYTIGTHSSDSLFEHSELQSFKQCIIKYKYNININELGVCCLQESIIIYNGSNWAGIKPCMRQVLTAH